MNRLEKKIISDWEKSGMISDVANKNGVSLEKARKILISNNIYPNSLSKEIAKMQLEGLSPTLIQKKLKISNKTYNAHVGYTKGRYKTDNPSKNAMKLRKWRKNKK